MSLIILREIDSANVRGHLRHNNLKQIGFPRVFLCALRETPDYTVNALTKDTKEDTKDTKKCTLKKEVLSFITAFQRERVDITQMRTPAGSKAPSGCGVC